MPEQRDAFELDGHHLIERGKVFPVCGNTWRMLANTRFAPHFDFIGDFGTHYGIFPGCGTSIPFAMSARGEVERGLLLGFRPQLAGGQCNTTRRAVWREALGTFFRRPARQRRDVDEQKEWVRPIFFKLVV